MNHQLARGRLVDGSNSHTGALARTGGERWECDCLLDYASSSQVSLLLTAVGRFQNNSLGVQFATCQNDSMRLGLEEGMKGPGGRSGLVHHPVNSVGVWLIAGLYSYRCA